MVNRPGGRRGFENRWCRKVWASSAPAIRQSEGQPAGRSASVGSGLDAQALWIETTAFRHGESIRAAPDPRSKRVSGVKPWRSTRRLSANFSQLSRREVRDPGSLISCSRRIRLPRLQTILSPCNQFRAGWALVSPTLCKSAVHSEVVRIHPCPPSSCHQVLAHQIRGRSSMVEHHVANVGTMGSISHRPLHFAQVAQR